MKNYLLLMMGGSGTRFGAEIPKQYIEINEIPVFAYILRKYAMMKEIDEIVIVSHADWIYFVKKWVDIIENDKPIHVVSGGDTRSGSVLNGLSEISDLAEANDIIMIHDATHPYVDVEGTKQVIEAVNQYGGATLGAFQYDTVYKMNEEHFIESVIDRKTVVSGASPEAFRFGDIYRIYSSTPEEDFERMTSAGAIALANGIEMKVIEADIINLKITYQKDMKAFRKLANNYFFED